MRPNWQPKIFQNEKVFPHQNQPSVYPPIRPPVGQPQPQPGLKPIIPQPRPAITKDPYWYQAETPTTKMWKPQITGLLITSFYILKHDLFLIEPFSLLIIIFDLILGRGTFGGTAHDSTQESYAMLIVPMKTLISIMITLRILLLS